MTASGELDLDIANDKNAMLALSKRYVQRDVYSCSMFYVIKVRLSHQDDHAGPPLVKQDKTPNSR